MKKIILKEKNITEQVVYAKLAELEKAVSEENYKVSDFGHDSLFQIVWGRPLGLLNTQEIRSAVYNYKWSQVSKDIARKFNIFKLRKSKLLTLTIEEACVAINRLIDYYNYIISTESIETVTFKSADPKEYPDKEVICRVVPKEALEDYLKNIPESEKFYARRRGSLYVRYGVPGEIINTSLVTFIDGKKYIYFQKSKKINSDEVHVAKNNTSVSKETFIIDSAVLYIEYHTTGINIETKETLHISEFKSSLVTRLPEDIIIKNEDGIFMVCPKGSYIIPVAGEGNYDYVSQADFDATYVKEEQPKRKRKRR